MRKLKHLAPYLPYGLKFHGNDKIYDLDLYNVSVVLANEDYKLLLRPLSDLYYKSASDLREDYDINYDIVFWLQELTIDKNKLKNITLETYEFLLSNHYDIFGLIDKGLAVAQTKP